MPSMKKSTKKGHHPRAKKAADDVAKALKAHKKLELELSNLHKNLRSAMRTWIWQK